ncbi:hypothetical protein CONPUDRAFT_77153 [Coniophora puteana RWD-64-598 SS2]|uniref:Uncharacterized protein n=1 Tax=Coniophora puteana (strain RWD-64-598) TaxID=741705 RepID=A0A5M3M9Z8_CONPW|nr:uncharacterized protein CONPUDRAFT_77153 [Coniophora puteana RWD-64-598 SS2]EIW75465.1 hypothetical protein CONPUDRAFT_77153 [Coniophora puteana RWD-64-598 SS2]
MSLFEQSLEDGKHKKMHFCQDFRLYIWSNGWNKHVEACKRCKVREQEDHAWQQEMESDKCQSKRQQEEEVMASLAGSSKLPRLSDFPHSRHLTPQLPDDFAYQSNDEDSYVSTCNQPARDPEAPIPAHPPLSSFALVVDPTPTPSSSIPAVELPPIPSSYHSAAEPPHTPSLFTPAVELPPAPNCFASAVKPPYAPTLFTPTLELSPTPSPFASIVKPLLLPPPALADEQPPAPLASTSMGEQLPSLGGIQAKYHPYSEHTPEIFPPHAFQRYPAPDPNHAPKKRPWRPFFEPRLKFKIAELAFEAGMTANQTNRFLNLIHCAHHHSCLSAEAILKAKGQQNVEQIA